VTEAPEVRAGLVGWNSGVTRTVPVKYSDGPRVAGRAVAGVRTIVRPPSAEAVVPGACSPFECGAKASKSVADSAISRVIGYSVFEFTKVRR
jgi:hypothetical protein